MGPLAGVDRARTLDRARAIERERRPAVDRQRFDVPGFARIRRKCDVRRTFARARALLDVAPSHAGDIHTDGGHRTCLIAVLLFSSLSRKLLALRRAQELRTRRSRPTAARRAHRRRPGPPERPDRRGLRRPARPDHRVRARARLRVPPARGRRARRRAAPQAPADRAPRARAERPRGQPVAARDRPVRTAMPGARAARRVRAARPARAARRA